MQYRRLKLACYTVNISMAIMGNLPPLLFLTFRDMYGISYSLLALLVTINFFTQLTIDLTFSLFSHKFNIPKTVKLTPVLTFIGLLIFAFAPFLFTNNVYLGFVIGTVVFSASGGLGEVLMSSTIAAIPSDDPEGEMSKLHAVYAWGVVAVIIISTLFIVLFGAENWQYLMLISAIVPLCSAFLFAGAKMPKMQTPEKMSGALKLFKQPALWLCVMAIFLGGASECTMSVWVSGYLEQALGIPKIWGDIFGVALFAAMLGLGRTLYSKIGKNIGNVLFFGAIGAAVCYIVAVFSPVPIFGLVACGFTGFCVSMMWPGSLLVASDRFPTGGVFIFAMMAMGGDLGASVGPQLIGIITDAAMKNETMLNLAQSMNLMPEQFGMKLGMLIGAAFPLIAIPVYYRIRKSRLTK